MSSCCWKSLYSLCLAFYLYFDIDTVNSLRYSMASLLRVGWPLFALYGQDVQMVILLQALGHRLDKG